MRLSQGFWQTYKEVPADAEIPSHQLMMRAGLIHKTGSGLYNYLPIGLRSIRKVENIIREELNKINCHEVTMTVVTPGELWKETGRWDKMGDLMLRFKDKKEQDLCISPTNEEAVVDIFRKTIKSYKQLPVSLYQINTKFRDEIRPRFGLMRGREFTMKDAYSFHIDKASLDKTYDEMYQAYSNIFTRLGLEFIPVEADGGAIATGDTKTHEFQVVADAGEDVIIYAAECGYAANIEKAQTIRSSLKFNTNADSMKEVPTPGKSTIEDVCTLLNIPQHHSLKALIYKAVVKNDKGLEKDQFGCAFLLGDDSLNEIKLQAAMKASHLAAATDNEIKTLGLVKGFIGVTNLPTDLSVIFDKSIDLNASYVIGAQKTDFHLSGFIPSRDHKNITQADLRLSKEGDLTLDGKFPVKIKKGIEVGHVFQLGDQYTKGMNVSVTDSNGRPVAPLMGCYGIGVTRVVAAAIEQHHDENGIIWPVALAPYQVYFVVIAKSAETKQLADEIYTELLKHNIEVIYDDRDQGPGFKFKDADLLGIPFQLVLGERDYNETGLFEVRERKSKAVHKVKREEIISNILKLLGK